MQVFKSIAIWAGIVILILFWVPLLFLLSLFDRDPVRYKTGRMFRNLGKYISKLNPNWVIDISGHTQIDDREPYVMVCNHLSNADIPLISNLPWEMKWVAKKELFDIPVLGSMLRWAKDIPVDRKSKTKKAGVFKACSTMLDQNISVMFFPEGTRSKTGKLQRFSYGAFDLALRKGVKILPMVIDGTQGCLPKKSWVFEPSHDIKLKVLPPVDVSKFDKTDVKKLTTHVREQILKQLALWRQLPLQEIDAMNRGSLADGVSV
jgi:1-acyl-sn-glycerol-3-phosphate acyltransferase